MTCKVYAVGLLSSEDILQFPSSFIDFTRSRCQNLLKTRIVRIGLEISLVSVITDEIVCP